MIRMSLLLINLLILSLAGRSQSCPQGGVVLNAQSQIDSFSVLYPDCDTIHGFLQIDGHQSIISNLNGLSGIRVVRENLTIIQCDSLKDFNGLEQLQLVGGTFGVRDNVSLITMSQLQSLDSIGAQLHISGNPVLENLKGLEKIGSLRFTNTIFNNSSLINLKGLDQLIEIRGDLHVINNHLLRNFIGLDSLKIIYGDLEIRGMDYMESFHGLANLNEIRGDLNIQSNGSLNNFEGLTDLTSIRGSFEVYNCDDLSSFSGLDNLANIASLSLSENGALVHLQGLETITTISKSIFITACQNLENVDGVSNATGLTDYILISNNDKLTDLEGLNQLCDDYLDYITILENPNLSICNAHCICEHLTSGGNYTIAANKHGCNTREEIVETCIVSVSAIEPMLSVKITPNPTFHSIEISAIQEGEFEYTISNTYGQNISTLTSENALIDVTYLPAGIYFIKVNAGSSTGLARFIKL